MCSAYMKYGEHVPHCFASGLKLCITTSGLRSAFYGAAGTATAYKNGCGSCRINDSRRCRHASEEAKVNLEITATLRHICNLHCSRSPSPAPGDTSSADDDDPYAVIRPDFVSDADDRCAFTIHCSSSDRADFRRRIRRFLDYTATEHTIYYITQLPPSRAWGVSQPHLLCVSPEGPPLRLWMLGTICRIQASTSSMTDPRTRVTFNLCFMRDVDRLSAKTLLQMSRPCACTSSNPDLDPRLS